MFRKILVVLIFSVATVGCRKHATLQVTGTGLTGSWKYIGYSRGFVGLRFTPAAAGVNNYLQFDASRLLLVYGGARTLTGYTYMNNSTPMFAGWLSLTDTTITPNKYDLRLLNDTLTLYPYNYGDAFTMYYTRSAVGFSW